MTLDLVWGTLSFSRNGKDLGVAVDDVPCTKSAIEEHGGSSGDAPPPLTLYPAFSLYNEDDQVTLLSSEAISSAAGSADARSIVARACELEQCLHSLSNDNAELPHEAIVSVAKRRSAWKMGKTRPAVWVKPNDFANAGSFQVEPLSLRGPSDEEHPGVFRPLKVESGIASLAASLGSVSTLSRTHFPYFELLLRRTCGSPAGGLDASGYVNMMGGGELVERLSLAQVLQEEDERLVDDVWKVHAEPSPSDLLLIKTQLSGWTPSMDAKLVDALQASARAKGVSVYHLQWEDEAMLGTAMPADTIRARAALLMHLNRRIASLVPYCCAMRDGWRVIRSHRHLMFTETKHALMAQTILKTLRGIPPASPWRTTDALKGFEGVMSVDDAIKVIKEEHLQWGGDPIHPVLGLRMRKGDIPIVALRRCACVGSISLLEQLARVVRSPGLVHLLDCRVSAASHETSFFEGSIRAFDAVLFECDRCAEESNREGKEEESKDRSGCSLPMVPMRLWEATLSK